jgi:hypothetical protein
MEAIMSSPVHQPKDLDAALMYAPPWARDQVQPVLPLAPTLPAPRPNRPGEFSGDRAMTILQRQLSLDPDKVPEPPTDAGRGIVAIILRFGVVSGAAALVAWAMVSIPGTRQAVEPMVPASFSPPTAMSHAKDMPKDASRTVSAARSPDRLVTTSEPSRQAEPAPSPPAPSTPQTETNQANAAPIAPAAVAQPAAVASTNAVVRLDSEEIATLVKRGRDFLTNGDLASARLLLRRAAEAGSAAAALALGSTFDPQVIQRLGAIGATPDVAKARRWYEKAAELGSDAAAGQLAKLSQSGQ